MFKIIITIISLALSFGSKLFSQIADPSDFLQEIKTELTKTWPDNRTINIVFHGHSVPSGYFKTPVVKTLEAYPYLTLKMIKEAYPYAVVNTITSTIGGENSIAGVLRFKNTVLNHRPDVLFIDYALNDRRGGLEETRQAWEKMIRMALEKEIKIILMTPTPDLKEDILSDTVPLIQHSNQIKELAEKYKIGLVDSYARFREIAQNEDLEKYMAQSNHINALGHQVVAEEIMKWFLE